MVLPLTQLVRSIFEYSFAIFFLNHSSVGGHLTDTLNVLFLWGAQERKLFFYTFVFCLLFKMN